MNARKKCKKLKNELIDMHLYRDALSSTLDVVIAQKIAAAAEADKLRHMLHEARSDAATWHMIADARRDQPVQKPKNIFKRIFDR